MGEREEKKRKEWNGKQRKVCLVISALNLFRNKLTRILVQRIHHTGRVERNYDPS